MPKRNHLLSDKASFQNKIQSKGENNHTKQQIRRRKDSYWDIYICIYIPLKSGLRTPLLTQSLELLSGSIGWGAGLQSSRLVQSKSSNPLKVL